MTKRSWLVLMLGVMYVVGAAAVDSADKPAKGQWDFRLQTQWLSEGAQAEPVPYASDLQVDGNGDIFLLEARKARVQVFSNAGKFITAFGRKGEGPGELKNPFRLFLIGNTLIISDLGKIHYFDKRGKYLRSVVLPDNTMSPEYFFDENRFLSAPVISPNNEGTVKTVIYDLKTKKQTLIGEYAPSKAGQATSDNGQQTMRVVVIVPSLVPIMHAASDGKRILMGFSDTYHLRVVDAAGREQLQFSLQRGKIPASYEVRSKPFANTKINGGTMPKDMLDQLVRNIPEHYTCFSGLYIDAAGRFFVTVPHEKMETSQWIDVFAADGRYLYKARLNAPAGEKFVGRGRFQGGFFYSVLENEDGDYRLGKFKIESPA